MKPFGSRALWMISIPLLFAEVSEIILHVTDTLFLSRVGVTELGAVGLADSTIEIALVLALGLVDGIQILTARRLGRGKPQQAVRVFNLGLYVTVGLSAALALLLASTARSVSPWLVDSPPVAQAVGQFLGIASIAMPFMVATFAYSALLVGWGRTRVLIPATLILTATNAGLDYVLIFGKLGLPALGIRGAALGSLIAEIVTFLFLTAYLARRPEMRRFGIFRLGGWSLKTLRRLLRISMPISLQGLVEALRWFLFFLILDKVGTIALAVGNVIYTCYTVLRIPTEAFQETACSAVSRLVGRNRTHRIDAVIQQSIRAAGVVTLPLVILALAAPSWILSAFALDAGLLHAAEASLRVIALAMLIVVPAQMWFTAVLGTGDTPAALGIEIALTVVMLGTSYVTAIPLAGSLALIWCSLGLGWLVTLVASYGWMRSGAWRRLAY